MFRCLSALAVALLLVGGANAAEVEGKITKIDAAKGLLVIKVGEDSKEFMVGKDCPCECPFGMALKDGLKTNFLFKEGAPVVVTYDTKDGKDIVTKVKSAVKINKQ